MKKFLFLLCCIICALFLTAGCAPSVSATQALPDITRETIGAWPENEYTENIPRPEYGTPDFILSGESDGCDYYSVFLSGITREQGEQYVSALKEAGFREIAADSNPASAGIVLRRDNLQLGVSISDGTLGLYFAFTS